MKRPTETTKTRERATQPGTHLSLKLLIALSICLTLFTPADNLFAANKAPAESLQQSEEEFINSLLEEKFRTARFSRTGADKCLSCHTSDGERIFLGEHGRSDLADGPFQHLECESCHGPLGRHPRLLPESSEIEPMVTFGKSSPVFPDNQNSICLNCHAKDHQQQNWYGSAHESSGVSCTSCHTLHKEKDIVISKSAQDKVCNSCHIERQMDTHKRSSHPLGESQMACSSCHNPHGSLNNSMLVQGAVNDTCTECHTEKRGPFLLEHAPVAEDCTNCHQPHSSNEKYLLTQRAPGLCQNCHTMHKEINFDESQNLEFRHLAGKSCLNCHAKIHGSNTLEHYEFRR